MLLFSTSDQSVESVDFCFYTGIRYAFLPGSLQNNIKLYGIGKSKAEKGMKRGFNVEKMAEKKAMKKRRRKQRLTKELLLELNGYAKSCEENRGMRK